MATFHENLVQSFHNFRDKYLKNYYVCSTDKSQYIKELTISGFTFEVGKRITVKFTDSPNNPGPSDASGKFSLRINGSKSSIIKNNSHSKTYSDMSYKYYTIFGGGQFHDFVYTGSFWMIMDINDSLDYDVYCLDTISIPSTIPTSIGAINQLTRLNEALQKLLDNDSYLDNKADTISTDLNNTVKYNNNAADISMTFSNGVLDITTTNK